MNDILGVEMAESHGDLNYIEASRVFGETLLLLHVSEELPTTDESHNEVESELSLEDVVHIDQELVLCLE